MSDPRSAAEILYPAQNGAAPGTARIELHYLPIAHRGHAFLRFVDSDGDTVGELHGLGQSKNTGKVMRMGMDGADLVVEHNAKERFDDTQLISTVASGSDDKMAQLWARGQKAADDINSKKFDYNSVAFTLGRAMNLDLDGAVQKAGVARKFPGWARDLLDPKYDRYVAPPDFPVTNAP